MSTQQAPAIDFSISQSPTNFQLVELPDELLAIIANHKDETPVLQLKSEVHTGNAVLCSPNATFPLRSVQTSNSLFVVQPFPETIRQDDLIPNLAIQAIATCSVTLELSKSTESAAPYLRKALPAYTSRDLNATKAVKASFKEICGNVPLSDAEIFNAWIDLCAFEEQGASFRPSTGLLLELWKAIMTASTADTIDLTSAFLIEDLWIAVREEEYPRGLYDALLRRVEDGESMDVDTDATWCTIDKARCIQWLAGLILETHTVGEQPMVVTIFLDIWKAHMPDAWRDNAALDSLQKLIVQPDESTVALKPEFRLMGPPTPQASASETQAPTAKKGKWHEKFKKTRT